MATIFSDLLTKTPPADLKKGSREAIDWFRNQAINITRVDKRTILNTKQPFRRLQTLSPNSVGKMYMFVYDAKLKDILPYWDAFPLIFPLEYYGDSFLGINLHYLPPITRARLMDALYSTINNKKYDKTTQLLISYQILKSASRFKYFEPCLKKYLVSHVGTPVVYISPDEWDFALLLPTQRFQKASAATVWKESMGVFA
jgi:hypothetical protein